MRTILIVIGTFISLILLVKGQIPPIYNSFRSYERSFEPCSDADNGWKCKNCTTLQHCSGTTPDYEISCAAQFPGRMYCSSSNNTCVSSQDACQQDFICPDKGLYPDLLNCQKYYSCPSVNAIGISYQCMFRSIYSHANRSCISNAICFSAKSACNRQYKVISYKPDPQCYVICQGSDTPLLMECPKNYIYNPTTIDCNYKCPSEGNFADPLDTTNSRYFICVYYNGVITAYPQECSDGQEFVADYGTCVDPS